MPKYHCYPLGEDHDATYREVVAEGPVMAAEEFRRIADQEAVEFPAESDVVVRSCHTGIEDVFTVTLHAEPAYTAKRKKVSG